MSNYGWKWVLEIPRGHFMAGLHRYKTKRDALAFADQYAKTSGNTITPRVYKAA